MAIVTDETIGTGYTAIDTTGNAPVILWNASDEDMTLQFGGGGDTITLAIEKGYRVPASVQAEALCASGGKTLKVLRGIEPVG